MPLATLNSSHFYSSWLSKPLTGFIENFKFVKSISLYPIFNGIKFLVCWHTKEKIR